MQGAQFYVLFRWLGTSSWILYPRTQYYSLSTKGTIEGHIKTPRTPFWPPLQPKTLQIYNLDIIGTIMQKEIRRFITISKSYST